MARIRRPYTRERILPASLQDALSISAPAPSYTISGARWNIAFKSNQDYSRIACLPVGVAQRERVSARLLQECVSLRSQSLTVSP